MAHDGQARRARQHHADLPAFPRPGAEPGRERLAVSPPELALKHRLRKLRRDRRRRMRRLAKAHRSTQNDHLHRNARLGSRRSAAMSRLDQAKQGDQAAGIADPLDYEASYDAVLLADWAFPLSWKTEAYLTFQSSLPRSKGSRPQYCRGQS